MQAHDTGNRETLSITPLTHSRAQTLPSVYKHTLDTPDARVKTRACCERKSRMSALEGWARAWLVEPKYVTVFKPTMDVVKDYLYIIIYYIITN